MSYTVVPLVATGMLFPGRYSTSYSLTGNSNHTSIQPLAVLFLFDHLFPSRTHASRCPSSVVEFDSSFQTPYFEMPQIKTEVTPQFRGLFENAVRDGMV